MRYIYGFIFLLFVGLALWGILQLEEALFGYLDEPVARGGFSRFRLPAPQMPPSIPWGLVTWLSLKLLFSLAGAWWSLRRLREP